MPDLTPPFEGATVVNDIPVNADGSFTIDDIDLANHLSDFGWTGWTRFAPAVETEAAPAAEPAEPVAEPEPVEDTEPEPPIAAELEAETAAKSSRAKS